MVSACLPISLSWAANLPVATAASATIGERFVRVVRRVERLLTAPPIAPESTLVPARNAPKAPVAAPTAADITAALAAIAANANGVESLSDATDTS